MTKRKVFLSCVLNKKDVAGIPQSVTLRAGYVKEDHSILGNEVRKEVSYVVETPYPPRMILENIVVMVARYGGERPSLSDPLRGYPEDLDPKYDDQERAVTYLADSYVMPDRPSRLPAAEEMDWLDEQNDKRKAIEGKTRRRNDLIIKLFIRFVRDLQKIR